MNGYSFGDNLQKVRNEIGCDKLSLKQLVDFYYRYYLPAVVRGRGKELLSVFLKSNVTVNMSLENIRMNNDIVFDKPMNMSSDQVSDDLVSNDIIEALLEGSTIENVESSLDCNSLPMNERNHLEVLEEQDEITRDDSSSSDSEKDTKQTSYSTHTLNNEDSTMVADSSEDAGSEVLTVPSSTSLLPLDVYFTSFEIPNGAEDCSELDSVIKPEIKLYRYQNRKSINKKSTSSLKKIESLIIDKLESSSNNMLYSDDYIQKQLLPVNKKTLMTGKSNYKKQRKQPRVNSSTESEIDSMKSKKRSFTTDKKEKNLRHSDDRSTELDVDPLLMRSERRRGRPPKRFRGDDSFSPSEEYFPTLTTSPSNVQSSNMQEQMNVMMLERENIKKHYIIKSLIFLRAIILNYSVNDYIMVAEALQNDTNTYDVSNVLALLQNNSNLSNDFQSLISYKNDNNLI